MPCVRTMCRPDVTRMGRCVAKCRLNKSRHALPTMREVFRSRGFACLEPGVWADTESRTQARVAGGVGNFRGSGRQRVRCRNRESKRISPPKRGGHVAFGFCLATSDLIETSAMSKAAFLSSRFDRKDLHPQSQLDPRVGECRAGARVCLRC